MPTNDDKKTPFTPYDDEAQEQPTEIMSREKLVPKQAEPEKEAPASETKQS